MAVLEEQACADRLRRAMQGDEPAYRQFLTEITPVMRGIVQARLPAVDASLREDVLQEVLLAVHAKRHTWRQSQPVLPWLYAICRYKCIDTLRGEQRRAVEVDDEGIDAIEAPDENLARDLDLKTVVSRLDGRIGEVVSAMAVDGLGTRETAERFGMTENAVRVAFHRGLKRVKVLLEVDDH